MLLMIKGLWMMYTVTYIFLITINAFMLYLLWDAIKEKYIPEILPLTVIEIVILLVSAFIIINMGDVG